MQWNTVEPIITLSNLSLGLAAITLLVGFVLPVTSAGSAASGDDDVGPSELFYMFLVLLSALAILVNAYYKEVMPVAGLYAAIAFPALVRTVLRLGNDLGSGFALLGLPLISVVFTYIYWHEISWQGLITTAVIVAMFGLAVYQWRRSRGSFEYRHEDAFQPGNLTYFMTIGAPYSMHEAVDELVDPRQENIEANAESLRDAWGCSNRADLLQNLENLRTDNHRGRFNGMLARARSLEPAELQEVLAASEDAEECFQLTMAARGEVQARDLLAWDLLRFFMVAGRGVTIGYISIDEYAEYCLPVARVLQSSFESWEDLYNSFLIGRRFWGAEASDEFNREFDNHQNALLKHGHGPCRKIPWDYALEGPESTVAVLSSTSFWRVVDQARPGALAGFHERLKQVLRGLSDDELSAFDNAFDLWVAEHDTVRIHSGAALLFPDDAPAFAWIMVWALYRGAEFSRALIEQCEAGLRASWRELREADAALGERHSVLDVLQENAAIFGLVRELRGERAFVGEIRAEQTFNPFIRSLTYEERAARTAATEARYPMNRPTAEMFPRLLQDLREA